MYRLDAGASGFPVTTWREVYENSGIAKPGQVGAGSGTTPTLIGRDLVAITDNADPMNVVVYRRAPSTDSSRTVCVQPVFEKGASATDNSLIAAGRGDRGREQLRLHRPDLHAGRQDDHARPGARRPRRRRQWLPLGLALPGDRADRRAQALGGQRDRLHVHEGPAARPPGRLVPDRAGLPHRQDALQAPRRRGARPQQQLRADHARPRRHRLRRRARRADRPARRDAAARRERAGADPGRPPPRVAAAEGPAPEGRPAAACGSSARASARCGASRSSPRGKRVRVDRKRPLEATLARKRLRRHGRTRIAARIVRKDGTRAKRVRCVRARR